MIRGGLKVLKLKLIKLRFCQQEHPIYERIAMRRLKTNRATCWVPAGVTTREGGEGARTPSNNPHPDVFVFVPSYTVYNRDHRDQKEGDRGQ